MEDNEYCEKHCKGYRDTGGRCFADNRCDAYWKYQKRKGTMKKTKGFLSKMLEKKTTEITESTEKPSTLPPPPPKKSNIDDIEDENVSKVIEQFDFERARSIMVLTARDIDHVPTIDELKKTAKRLLMMCMEHQDREFWWAGGMHHGGICATYDNKWGLSLLYIEGVSRVKINDVRG